MGLVCDIESGQCRHCTLVRDCVEWEQAFREALKRVRKTEKQQFKRPPQVDPEPRVRVTPKGRDRQPIAVPQKRLWTRQTPQLFAEPSNWEMVNSKRVI